MCLSAYLLLRRIKWQELEDQFTISITTRKRPTKETVLILVNLTQVERHSITIIEVEQPQAKPAGAKNLIEAKDDEHA